jgi:hypothetical protein
MLWHVCCTMSPLQAVRCRLHVLLWCALHCEPPALALNVAVSASTSCLVHRHCVLGPASLVFSLLDDQLVVIYPQSLCHSSSGLRAGFPPRRWPDFQPRLGHVRFVVDKVLLWQVFSQYFSFPCQFSFHQMLHTHHLSPGCYNRPVSGRRKKWTQSHPTPRN